MKTYADNLEYQGFLTALNEAKSIVEATKAKKKEVEAVFKTAKKEDAPKEEIYAAHFQFKQAKLKHKFEALALDAAKLDLKGFVHAFKQAEKEAAKAAKKAEAIEKEAAKKATSSQSDMVDKPSSKVGKNHKSIKVVATEGKIAPEAVDTKKTAKVKDAKKAAKKQLVEAAKVVKVKVPKKQEVETIKAVKVKAPKKQESETSKAVKVKVANVSNAQKQAVEATKMAEAAVKAANAPVVKKQEVQTEKMAEVTGKAPNVTVVKKQEVDAPQMAEATVQAAESTPIKTQSVAKNEVVILKRTPINDLTIIEGIGPKVAKILYDKGVKNFKALINTSVEDIKTWLKENKLQFIDPTTWAEQAQLADDDKMVEFEALKKELKSGKRGE